MCPCTGHEWDIPRKSRGSRKGRLTFTLVSCSGADSHQRAIVTNRGCQREQTSSEKLQPGSGAPGWPRRCHFVGVEGEGRRGGRGDGGGGQGEGWPEMGWHGHRENERGFVSGIIGEEEGGAVKVGWRMGRRRRKCTCTSSTVPTRYQMCSSLGRNPILPIMVTRTAIDTKYCTYTARSLPTSER